MSIFQDYLKKLQELPQQFQAAGQLISSGIQDRLKQPQIQAPTIGLKGTPALQMNFASFKPTYQQASQVKPYPTTLLPNFQTKPIVQPLGVPLGQAMQNIPQSFVGGWVGDIIKSTGKTLEKYSTPQGRQLAVQQFKQISPQNPFIKSPLFEDVMNASNFIPGFGLVPGFTKKVGEKAFIEGLAKSEKLAPEVIQGLKTEGAKILETLPKEMRLQHIVNYANELFKRGFSKPQIDKIGAQEGAAILKQNISPVQRFGKVVANKVASSGNESMRFLQDVADETRKIKDPYQTSQTIDEAIRNASVKNKVNLLDYLRTPNRVLEKIGLGNEAKLLRQKYDDYLMDLPKELDKVTTWSKRVTPEANQRIFQWLDGKKVDLGIDELKVATEIKTYLKDWAQKLGLPADKQISSYITHLFPKGAIEREFDPEIAQLIQGKVVESVYDPFLQRRVGRPDYLQDTWQALTAYLKRGVRKYHMDQALDNMEYKASKLPGESYDYIKGQISRINMQPMKIDTLIDNLVKSSPIGYRLGQRPVASATRTARQAVFRALLGLNPGTALRNIQQSTNSYAMLGEKQFGVGLVKTIQNLPRLLVGKDTELEQVGVLTKNILQDQTINPVKKFWEHTDNVLFYMFNFAEKFNRGIAYWGGKSKAISQGMNEQEAIAYAKDIVGKTQFFYDVIDTPAALQSDLAKTLLQFGKYPLAQSEFLIEMLKRKDVAGSVRWLGSNLLFIATAGKLLGLDYGDMFPDFSRFAPDKFSPPTLKPFAEAGRSIINAPDQYGRVSKDQNPLTRLYNNPELRKGLLNFVPGGGQLRRTIEGLGAYQQGASTTPTGRTRYEVPQTPGNAVKMGLFGQFATSEGRSYIENLGKSQGQVIYEQINKLKTPQEKTAKWNELVQSGAITKTNASDIKQYFTDKKLGLSSGDEKIRALEVQKGSRARAVAKALNNAKTPQEKTALWNKFVQAKILTPEVAAQVKALLGRK